MTLKCSINLPSPVLYNPALQETTILLAGKSGFFKTYQRNEFVLLP